MHPLQLVRAVVLGFLERAGSAWKEGGWEEGGIDCGNARTGHVPKRLESLHRQLCQIFGMVARALLARLSAPLRFFSCRPAVLSPARSPRVSRASTSSTSGRVSTSSTQRAHSGDITRAAQSCEGSLSDSFNNTGMGEAANASAANEVRGSSLPAAEVDRPLRTGTRTQWVVVDRGHVLRPASCSAAGRFHPVACGAETRAGRCRRSRSAR
jgi:hypothetical protein